MDKLAKVKAEVERLMYGFNLEADIASCEDAETEKLANIKYQLCKKILEYIDSLQESKEVNLDNFIKEEFNKYSCVDGYGQLSVSYNMAEFHSMIKRLINAQKGE